LTRDDAINIQFTSGTTGLPKGATLSHRNILNNGYFVGSAHGLGPEDRICIPVPLYHCFGMVMGNLACITTARRWSIPAEAFDPLRGAARGRGGALHRAVRRADHVHRGARASRIDAVRPVVAAHRLHGGGDLPRIEVMRQVIERMNMRDVTIAYGMTETSPVSFQTATERSARARVGTIGRVQPHLECKLIDEDGAIVPRARPASCARAAIR
jgi:fatty-acyl-CoA synthase